MPIIITILIAIFFVEISWAWHNLGDIEKPKKIATILIALIILFIITLLVFNISAGDVKYENKEIEQNVRNVLVLVFTIINGLIIIPPFAKTFGRINEKTVNITQARNHFIFLIVVSVVILFIESIYLKEVQQGILDVFHNAVSK